MKAIGDVTACFVDNSGYFLPLARSLGGERGFKRVLFHNPNWEKGSPALNEAVIGDGFKDVEWCGDFWPIKREVDLFIFPDLNRRGLQGELRSQGFPVWGAGAGMRLETNREFFLHKLLDLGLDVPAYQIVTGISALREFLKDKEDIYIKMSKWRGTWETKHWRNWKADAHRLDYWAVKFGGMREKVRFICFPRIETKLEIGADTYTVDGQWPDLMLHGIEKKDEAYFSAVTPVQEMPEDLVRIMDAFSPFLKGSQARTQWSMEVRKTESEAFFIDATVRGGLPSTGSLACAVTNLPEIIYHGAQGQLVQPDYQYQFTAECMVRVHGDPGCWETMIVPEELAPWLKLADCCQVDGQVWFPADEEPIEEVGWLVSGGQTPRECLEMMNRNADALPDGADAAVESLAEIIREIEEEQKQGIEFTEQPLPPAEIVLEESK